MASLEKSQCVVYLSMDGRYYSKGLEEKNVRVFDQLCYSIQAVIAR